MSQLPSEYSCEIGVIGGSGLYAIDALTDVHEVALATPYGAPSDTFRIGTLAGRRVAFLPRHGAGHRLSPSELPHRANIHAFKQLGVRWLLAASAVGSLKEELAPGHFVFPDQFFDRTKRDPSAHTFFGNGIVAHVAFGDPVCHILQEILREAALDAGAVCHRGGTYVNMEGPAFSTRAESAFHRAQGWDVVGMTNLAEAKLAREAEISYAPMSMVTDYDAWKEEVVDIATVVRQLHANAELARKTIEKAIPAIPIGRSIAAPRAQHALDGAILTPREHWPEARIEELGPLLARYV